MGEKLRIIVQCTGFGAAANVGGPVNTEYLTFDVDAPDDLVKVMRAKPISYEHRSFVGVQLLPTPDEQRASMEQGR